MEIKERKPETIDEYINSFPEDIQSKLNEIRNLIRDTVPQANEKISWSMPTYTLRRNLVHFAGYKKHIGFYPGVDAIVAFQDRLTEYKTSKGAVQFPYNEPLPKELIIDMVNYQVKENSK